MLKRTFGVEVGEPGGHVRAEARDEVGVLEDARFGAVKLRGHRRLEPEPVPVFRVSGSGFKISGVDFRFEGFGFSFKVSGSVLDISGFGSRLGFQVSGSWFRGHRCLEPELAFEVP